MLLDRSELLQLHRINYGGSNEREASCGDWLRSPGENPHRGIREKLNGIYRVSGVWSLICPGGHREEDLRLMGPLRNCWRIDRITWWRSPAPRRWRLMGPRCWRQAASGRHLGRSPGGRRPVPASERRGPQRRQKGPSDLRRGGGFDVLKTIAAMGGASGLSTTAPASSNGALEDVSCRRTGRADL